MSARWTEERMAVLRRDYGTRPAGEIAAELGTTTSAVYNAAIRAGLAHPQAYTRWTPDRIAILAAWYGVMPSDQLARELGISLTALHNAAREHKLAYHANRARKLDEADRAIRRLSILLAWQRDQISAELAARAIGCRPQRLPALAIRAAAWGAKQATDTATERKEKAS